MHSTKSSDIKSKFKLKAIPIKVDHFSGNIIKPDFETNHLSVLQLFTENMAFVNLNFMMNMFLVHNRHIPVAVI